MLKDSEILNKIVEQIALELDIKINIEIDLDTYLPNNYFLNSDKNVLRHPI